MNFRGKGLGVVVAAFENLTGMRMKSVNHPVIHIHFCSKIFLRAVVIFPRLPELTVAEQYCYCSYFYKSDRNENRIDIPADNSFAHLTQPLLPDCTYYSQDARIGHGGVLLLL